jgi:hypothetical protein
MIATDGQHSCAAGGRHDRYATKAIVRSAARLTIAWATKRWPGSAGIGLTANDRNRPIPSVADRRKQGSSGGVEKRAFA